MKISNTHQRFADRLRNQRALDHPEEFLGPNWKDVLNFWLFLDTLTEEQLNSIRDAYFSLSDDEFQLARQAAHAAGYAANSAGLDAALFTSGYAACELIGSHILQEQGKSLVFLPLYLKFSQ